LVNLIKEIFPRIFNPNRWVYKSINNFYNNLHIYMQSDTSCEFSLETFRVIHDFLFYWKCDKIIRVIRKCSSLSQAKISLRSFRFIHKDVLAWLCKTVGERRFASGYFGLAWSDWRLVFIVWPNLLKSRRWRDVRRAGERNIPRGISTLVFRERCHASGIRFSPLRIGGTATKLTPKRWVTRSLSSATTVFSYVTLRDLDFKVVVFYYICKDFFFHKFFH